MTRPPGAQAFETARRQVKHDRMIEVALGSIDELTAGEGDGRSGVDFLVGVLDSSLRLPETLVVRIRLPGGAGMPEPDVSPFHDLCRVRADEAWREAMTLRAGGIRALPRALMLSVGAGTLGVVSGALAQGTESTLLMVLLYAVAFLAVIAAWTMGWTPIEQASFDWRAPAHTAAAYELLSQAHVEVVGRSPVVEPVP